MSPCRRQGGSGRRQAASAQTAQPAAASDRAAARTASQEPAVHRYIHPIRTARPARREQPEELLARVLEGLARQTALLEELLRRTDSNKPDTN